MRKNEGKVRQMTLGEKIRSSRKNRGLSQEQLAEKMAVSRSAIAKWETDKGLPDVGNLKVLARLLGVSVDQLLDESEAAAESVIREAYCLAAYGRGCKKVKKDRFMCERFPDSKIYTLFARQEHPERIPEDLSDCRAGSPERADQAFYIVQRGDSRQLVAVSDAFIEIRPLARELGEGSFCLDGWSFIRSNYELTV